MSWGRDRDDNGIPDWQEDENYLDEAPQNAPVRAGGCLIALLSLLRAVATVALGWWRRGDRA